MCGLKRPHKTSGEPCWATTKTNVVCFVYYSNIFLVRCNLVSDPRSNHRYIFMKTSNMYTYTIIYIIAEWTNNVCMIQTYITWHIKMINSWFWYTALRIKRNDVHLPGLFTYSFNHLFIYLFIYSFIYLIINLFIHLWTISCYIYL